MVKVPGRLAQFLFHSIRGRIIAGVVALYMVLIGLVVADMVHRQRNFMQSQLAGTGQSMAATLAVNAPSWLIANDVTGLGELVESNKSAPNMQLAMIMDRDGRVRAATDDSLFNLVLTDTASRSLLVGLAATEDHRYQFWHDGMVDSVAIIESGGRHVGFARVLLDAAPVQAELDAVTRKGIAYAVLAMLIGGLLAWLTVRTMTQRLQLLSRAADDIAAGKLDVSLPEAHGSDEVARLTRDFKQMSVALAGQMAHRLQSEAALFAEKERALVTLNSIGDGVITTDVDGRIEFLNPAAEELTDWTSAAARGRPVGDVLRLVDAATRGPVEDPVQQVLALGWAIDVVDRVLIRRDLTELHIEDSASPIRDRQGEVVGVIVVFHDVTQAREMARQISFQASHDLLTGLINRHEFESRLTALIHNAATSGRRHALAYLDLDQFKVINDTCGHRAGDQFLRDIAGLIEDMLGPQDTLARISGDEFGILLQDRAGAAAQEACIRLLEAIQAHRFEHEGNAFFIGASIGLVMIDAAAVGAAALLSAADAACYAAKEQGRNRIQVYDAENDELLRRHGEMNWVARINKAFDEDRFVLYCQPIVRARPREGAVRHCEVLVRMLDESGRLVPPNFFIPAAERYNLMGAIDRWVVKNALAWLIAGDDEDSRCAINLSGQSIGQEDFLVFIVAQIKATGVDPRRICLEITETAAIANLGRALHFMRELKALGCRFALDDFGSGLSSFAYLKNLPVDYLKIDGKFVKDMVENPIDRAMVEAIHHVGSAIGIETIAEFVENEAIAEQLRAIGVDYLQGFGIARPAALGTLGAWMPQRVAAE